MTTYLPKDEVKKKTGAEEEYNLSKIQTNNSLKRTKSRRESNTATSKTALPRISIETDDTDSPALMRHRKSAPFVRRMKPMTENQDEVCIEVPRNFIEAVDIPEITAEEQKKEKPPFMLRIRYGIWTRLKYFSRYEFKFALKMAVTVTVLCLPALVPSSSSWYYNVRGQWAPMTVIAIMNPTR